jgi:glyoxylase-like metal-dependent hydrolase (beta-lactamase superfamily II)
MVHPARRGVLIAGAALFAGAATGTSDLTAPLNQIVPYKDASLLQAKLLKPGTLKIYPGFPHGMMTTNAGAINADLLSFIKT